MSDCGRLLFCLSRASSLRFLCLRANFPSQQESGVMGLQHLRRVSVFFLLVAGSTNHEPRPAGAVVPAVPNIWADASIRRVGNPARGSSSRHRFAGWSKNETLFFFFVILPFFNRRRSRTVFVSTSCLINYTWFYGADFKCLPSFTGFHSSWQSFLLLFEWVLANWVISRMIEWNQVLFGFTWFSWAFTEYYLVLLGFTGFQVLTIILLSFNRCHCYFSWFNWILLGFSLRMTPFFWMWRAL